jgi:hypothetical protein
VSDLVNKMSKPEKDGWYYHSPIHDNYKSPYRLVTLVSGGTRWVAIRFWNHKEQRWEHNGDPELVFDVVCWRELPEPASGFWDRGVLQIYNKHE